MTDRNLENIFVINKLSTYFNNQYIFNNLKLSTKCNACLASYLKSTKMIFSSELLNGNLDNCTSEQLFNALVSELDNNDTRRHIVYFARSLM